jgi:hypothetical protein
VIFLQQNSDSHLSGKHTCARIRTRFQFLYIDIYYCYSFYSGPEDLEGRTMLADRLLKPQCSQYYPITLWLREITWTYTDLHRAAWEPSSVKSQSASNQGLRTLLKPSVFNLPCVAETHASKECCKLGRSEAIQIAPHLPNSERAFYPAQTTLFFTVAGTRFRTHPDSFRMIKNYNAKALL